MDHFFELIRDFIKERISNPITTKFSISWAFWNYKFIIIILSDNTVSATFELIKEHSFTGPGDILTNGILYPLISTALYIFVYPMPTKLAYKYSLQKNLELIQARNEVENTQQLTVEESKKLRVQHAKEVEEYRSALQEKEEQIKALLDEIKTNKPPTQLVTNAGIKNDNQTDENQQENKIALSILAKMIEKSNDSDFIPKDQFLILTRNLSQTIKKLIIANLLQRGLIEKCTFDDIEGYTILPKGHLEAFRFQNYNPP